MSGPGCKLQYYWGMGETFLGLEQAAELEEDLKCIKTFDSAKDFL